MAFKGTRPNKIKIDDVNTIGERYMQKETSIRRFSASFSQLRLEHRRVKNLRKPEVVREWEEDKFCWPVKNDPQELEVLLPDEGDSADENEEATVPTVTMSGRPSGTRGLLEFQSEHVSLPPQTCAEQLVACQEKLKEVSMKLKEANQEMESLRRENLLLKKKRGLMCKCKANCLSHFPGSLPKPLVRAKRKQFDQLTVYGRRKGLRDVRGLFKIKEVQYNAPVSRMAGFLIHQEEYNRDRKLAKVGSALADGTLTSLTRMPLDQALYLRYYGKMGKVGYTNVRLALLNFGVELPTYNQTSDYKFENIVPTQLEEYKDSTGMTTGLGYQYRESLEISVRRLLSHLGLETGPDLRYKVEIRDGFDAFRVSWYQQFGVHPEKPSSQTIPVTHWSYSLLRLTELPSGKDIFEEKSVSSPFISAPLFLQYGSENEGTLGGLIQAKAREQKDLRENPLVVGNGCQVEVVIKTQGDGKVKKLVSGINHGCTACDFSPENYNDVEVIAAGTKMNRSFESSMEVWNKLVNKRGNIKKSIGDYEVRKGLTKKPLADIEFVEITVLHLWIHALTFLLRIAVHLRCGHLLYDETADVKVKCDIALKEIQQIMLPPRAVQPEDLEVLSKEDLEGVALSFPDSSSAGNTNTGNTARRCLMKDHLRERLVGTVPEEHQEAFRKFVLGTAVALAVISSSGKVSPDFEDHLTSTVLDAKRAWPNLIQLSESMHQLFGHSYEMIENNNMRGLKNLSEENTESANKLHGQVRENWTRKDSAINCLKDMLIHARVRSDPIVRSFRRILTCPVQSCGQEGHTRRGCPLRSDVSGCTTQFQELLSRFI